MASLHLSIIEGSPYYEKRGESANAEASRTEEEEQTSLTQIVARTFDPVDFANLHGRLPCMTHHLSQPCSNAQCQYLHDEVAFTKFSISQLRLYARTLPCPLALSCSPFINHSCPFCHVCPSLKGCVDKECGFNALSFDGRGHEPNPASEIYSETNSKGTYAHILPKPSPSTPLMICETNVSTTTPPDRTTESSVFDPLVKVLLTMNEADQTGVTRHHCTSVLEQLMEGFPDLFIHTAFHSWPEYILAAEEAGIVALSETYDRAQWIELAE